MDGCKGSTPTDSAIHKLRTIIVLVCVTHACAKEVRELIGALVADTVSSGQRPVRQPSPPPRAPFHPQRSLERDFKRLARSQAGVDIASCERTNLQCTRFVIVHALVIVRL